jgi:hypothetical protein
VPSSGEKRKHKPKSEIHPRVHGPEESREPQDLDRKIGLGTRGEKIGKSGPTVQKSTIRIDVTSTLTFSMSSPMRQKILHVSHRGLKTARNPLKLAVNDRFDLKLTQNIQRKPIRNVNFD